MLLAENVKPRNTQETPAIPLVETDKEWLSIPEASELTGIKLTTLNYRIQRGDLTTHKRNIPNKLTIPPCCIL